jgi:antitoxin (DNA-binding transcriptional repressor) of toxin-antitoxin stability system
VIIAKHGEPVARIVGALQIYREPAREAVEKLNELRRGTTLGGLSWKGLRDHGRR